MWTWVGELVHEYLAIPAVLPQNGATAFLPRETKVQIHPDLETSVARR